MYARSLSSYVYRLDGIKKRKTRREKEKIIVAGGDHLSHKVFKVLRIF